MNESDHGSRRPVAATGGAHRPTTFAWSAAPWTRSTTGSQTGHSRRRQSTAGAAAPDRRPPALHATRNARVRSCEHAKNGCLATCAPCRVRGGCGGWASTRCSRAAAPRAPGSRRSRAWPIPSGRKKSPGGSFAMARTRDELVTPGGTGSRAGPATHGAPNGGDRRRRGVRLGRDVGQLLRPRLDGLQLGLHRRQVAAVHRLETDRRTQNCRKTEGGADVMLPSAPGRPRTLTALACSSKRLRRTTLRALRTVRSCASPSRASMAGAAGRVPAAC